MSDWWLSRASGAPEGPFPSQTLVHGLTSGQIPSQAYVCLVGAQRWVRISEVDEIWEAAHPEQGKTNVTEQPWFTKAAEDQAKSLRDTSGLADADDENERTQLIAPLPAVTPVPVVPPSQLARPVKSPVPAVTQVATSRPANTPLPTANPVPNARPLLTPLPTANPIPNARPLLTPLPRAEHSSQQGSPAQVAAQSDGLGAYRAKIPTLEGIQDSSVGQAPPGEPGPAHLPRSTVSTGASQPEPIAKPRPTPKVALPQPISRETALGPSSPKAQPNPLPMPVRNGASTTMTQPTPPAAGMTTQSGASTAQANISRSGFGLAPLPRATSLGPNQSGLGAQPSSPTKQASAPVVLGNNAPTSGGAEQDRSTSIGAGLAQHTAQVAVTSGPATGPFPAILGVAGVIAGSPGSALSPRSPTEPAKAATAPTQETSHQTASSSEPEDETDVEEVTAIASTAQLRHREKLRSAGDDDVTTIVPAIELPSALGTDGTPLADDEATTALRSQVAPVAPATQPARNDLPELDFSSRKSATAVGPGAVSPSLAQAMPPRVPMPVSTGHEAAVVPLPSVKETAPAGSGHREVDASCAPLADASPDDLLEADIDDNSVRIHSVPPGSLVSSTPLAQRRAPNEGGPPSVPTKPIISQPPKAIHQAVSPSIVLKPEPVVHQEATKPAVRAMRPRGVIQITYGTLIVGVLAIALFVLLVVLLLK